MEKRIEGAGAEQDPEFFVNSRHNLVTVHGFTVQHRQNQDVEDRVNVFLNNPSFKQSLNLQVGGAGGLFFHRLKLAVFVPLCGAFDFDELDPVLACARG